MRGLLFDSVQEQRQSIARALPRSFPDFSTGGDIFRQRLNEHLHPGATVLDAGCGTGGIIVEYRPRIGRLIGVDRDAGALALNAALNERITADLGAIPLADASVDIITAEFVMEHIDTPLAVLAELHRVLRPGGRLIFLTSNRQHPVMTMSRRTPTGFHRWAKWRFLHREDAVFPARYRLNTPREIRRLAKLAGWHVNSLTGAGNPEYLAFAPWLVVPAIKLERWLAAHTPDCQMYIVAELMKPS